MADTIHITRREVGDAVRLWRQKNGMSQKEMGSLVGKSGAWIGKLERFPDGYRPCGMSLLALLVLMGNQVGYARGVVAAIRALPYCDERAEGMRQYDRAVDDALEIACIRAEMCYHTREPLLSEFRLVDVVCDDNGQADG